MSKNTVEFTNSKLFLHKDKFDKLLIGEYDSPPILAELTLTSTCNLSCFYCSDHHFNEYHAGRWDKDRLLEVLKELKNFGVKSIVVEGGGEPTLHPDFNEIIKNAYLLGLNLGLITNGTTDLPCDIINCFEWIRVSLDASTPQEYKDIKGKDFFSEVLENLEKYSSCAKDTVVGVGYLLSTCSNGDLEGVVQKCKTKGVDYFQIRRLDDADEYDIPPNYDVSDLLKHESEEFKVYTHQIYTEDSDEGNYGLPCYANSLSTVIAGDGKVFFCCRLHSYVNLNDSDCFGVIGNLYEDSFKDIWYGETRANMKEKMLSADECLRLCPSCRISKYNKLLHEFCNCSTPNFI